MVSQGHLPHDDDLVDKIRAALLSGHEHQGEKKKGITAIKSVTDFVARRDSDSHIKTHGKCFHKKIFFFYCYVSCLIISIMTLVLKKRVKSISKNIHL